MGHREDSSELSHEKYQEMGEKKISQKRRQRKASEMEGKLRKDALPEARRGMCLQEKVCPTPANAAEKSYQTRPRNCLSVLATQKSLETLPEAVSGENGRMDPRVGRMTHGKFQLE